MFSILFFHVDWNKDWKAGKYPETEEERKAAAKKYGMHPSEYQPYPDDGMGFGDYPKLKDIPVERRDPYYPWDMPELKRNFGDPVSPLYVSDITFCERLGILFILILFFFFFQFIRFILTITFTVKIVMVLPHP